MGEPESRSFLLLPSGYEYGSAVGILDTAADLAIEPHLPPLLKQRREVRGIQSLFCRGSLDDRNVYYSTRIKSLCSNGSVGLNCTEFQACTLRVINLGLDYGLQLSRSYPSLTAYMSY